MERLTEEEELASVFRRRYKEARAAGLLPDDAMAFAHSDADVGELRKLAAAGVEADMIVRIVL